MDKIVFMRKAKQSCETAVRKANEFLKPLDLSLAVNWNYDFNGFYRDSIGVYERGSVFCGKISVGCNINKLYEACEHNIESYPWSNPDIIIDETIQTNIFHEMGHGVVEQIEFYLNETDELDTLYDENKELFDSVFDNEEDAVEELAWELYDNTPTNSRLGRLIRLFIGLNAKTQEDKIKKKNGTMTKKQIIRLNDDQLKRFVKDCIEEVTSKLYQNAAMAAYEKGKYYDEHDSRVMKFRQAAVNRHRDNNKHIVYHTKTDSDDCQEKYIANNSGNKLFIFDSDYKNLRDLYNGVKQGRLLIHCREVDENNIPHTIFPEFGETVKDAYASEIPDGCSVPELIFASDRFNWAKNYSGNRSKYTNKRNGVFFLYGDSFEMSIGDGYVQTIDGNIYRRDDEPITVEQDDWFSDEPADVAAVMIVGG